MIHDKKVSMGVGFVSKISYEYEGKKFEADVKDGDLLKILDEGEQIQGKFGIQVVHKVETRNGSKALTVNQTSINNLIDVFGKDSKEWVGKTVKAWVFKTPKDGKMQYIVYLSDPSWEMNEEGKFLSPEKGDVIIDEGSGDINFDDIG